MRAWFVCLATVPMGGLVRVLSLCLCVCLSLSLISDPLCVYSVYRSISCLFAQSASCGVNNPSKDGAASNRITPRAENFSQWYLDVIAASEMTENSPVKVLLVS